MLFARESFLGLVLVQGKKCFQCAPPICAVKGVETLFVVCNKNVSDVPVQAHGRYVLSTYYLNVNGATKLPYNDNTIMVGRDRVWIAPRRKQFNDANPLAFVN